MQEGSFEAFRADFLNSILSHVPKQERHDETCEMERQVIELLSRAYYTREEISSAVQELVDPKPCKCKKANR